MLLFNDISVYLTKVIQWLRQITGYKAMGFAMSMSHNQYRVWPPLAWLTAAHFCRIDITRSSVVSCRMFSHSSWRAICNWLMFTGSRCQRRTAWSRTSQTCSILGQIRGICRPMKHKEILVIQKLCPCGRRVGWHCRAKNGILAIERQDNPAQYLIPASDSIQITNNDMQLCVKSKPPKQMCTSATVCHPSYDSDVSISLPCATSHVMLHIFSVKRETWLVTEENIPLSCWRLADEPPDPRESLSSSSRLNAIHVEGDVRRDHIPAVDFGQFEGISVHWIDRQSRMQWLRLLWGHYRFEVSGYSGLGKGSSREVVGHVAFNIQGTDNAQ